ncbi:globin domain-containing protein [Nigerium massiliense]|uniref:globin domain-containing protein n=1 Tax=Nigerium massiliense TaxID=1522317 RepID=UPI000A5171C3|nr:globin [Nigerium massiliense]
MADAIPQDEQSYYERVGGHETFVRLIRAFFVGLKTDPDLVAMYPADDMDGAEARLLAFFEQYWGGPPVFSRTRGAPLLRQRHMPYKVTLRMKERWLHHMHAAISTIPFSSLDELLMRDYVERAAAYLVNADD